jgi:hypothetical protein
LTNLIIKSLVLLSSTTETEIALEIRIICLTVH